MAVNRRQFIRWRYLRDRYFQPDDPATFLDVLDILDCCYAGSAVRGGQRTCQLLAACDEKYTVRSRKGGITFTQRLVRAMHGLRLQSTKPFALVEELFAEIQRKNRIQPRMQCSRRSQDLSPLPSHISTSSFHLLLVVFVSSTNCPSSLADSEQID